MTRTRCGHRFKSSSVNIALGSCTDVQYPAYRDAANKPRKPNHNIFFIFQSPSTFNYLKRRHGLAFRSASRRYHVRSDILSAIHGFGLGASPMRGRPRLASRGPGATPAMWTIGVGSTPRFTFFAFARLPRLAGAVGFEPTTSRPVTGALPDCATPRHSPDRALVPLISVFASTPPRELFGTQLWRRPTRSYIAPQSGHRSAMADYWQINGSASNIV